MDLEDENGRRGARPGVVAGGAMLLAVGLAMLLSTSGVVDVAAGQLVGPFVLITLGTLILIEKGAVVAGCRERSADGTPRLRLRRRGGSTAGLWLIGIGVWMMVSQLHLWGLSYGTSWPLFLILSGIVLLVRGIR